MSGTTAGGTPVTITGTGFLAGATVTIGGTAATGVAVGSSTSITATTPAHAAGAVNVVVTNTDTQTGTLTNGYTYTTSGGGGSIAFVQVNSAQSFTPVTYAGGDLCGGAECGKYEYRCGGMERHHAAGEFGDGQPWEHLHTSGRDDDRDRIAAGDLLRQQHRGREQHGYGDVQRGGDLSRHPDSGVQRARPEILWM